ncbi:MAG: sulfatase [Lentisphaeraceae bacterium]|nr:sulfatase [Lentisphaeraceae bacterium]
MSKKLITLTLLLTLSCFTVAEEQTRPNILWIFLEDTSPYFGCFGDEVNKNHTPTVDKLAQEGVLFKRCYMPAPVCSATRSAMIVGTMQTTTGTHQHRAARCTAQRDGKSPKNLYLLPKPYIPIPQLMKEAGYHTFNNGKDDYNFTYDRRKLYTSGNPQNYQYPYNGWQGWFGKGSWNDRQDKSQPWFGQIMLWGGKSNAKLLAKKDTLAPGAVALPPYFPNTKSFNKSWTHHWNACRYADVQVQEILDNLKKDGELENTIIFFFSDHGDNKSLRHKQFCFEGGVHVPLIISGTHPAIKKGQVRPELMSGLDIGATTLAMAGLKLPTYLDGQYLFGKEHKKRDFVISARDRCDYTIDRIRTVRTENFRYIRNFKTDRALLQPQYRDKSVDFRTLKSMHENGTLDGKLSKMYFGKRDAEELYDMKNDPHQMNNLAFDSNYKAELEKHRAILTKWIKETDDKGQYPESDEEMKAQLRFWKSRAVNPEYDKYKKEIGVK